MIKDKKKCGERDKVRPQPIGSMSDCYAFIERDYNIAAIYRQNICRN